MGGSRSEGATSSLEPTPSTSTATPIQNPQRPKPILPNPPRFGGERRNYESWKAGMTAKLRVDNQSLGSYADQFVYIYAHLEGAAQQMCLAYFQHTVWTSGATPDNFIAYLDRSYKDPNRQMRATNQLRIMKQGESSFAAFLPKFERALADAGASEWADQAKVAFLEGALNQRLIRALVTERMPKQYGEYVSRILEIDGKLQALPKMPAYGTQERARAQQSRASPELGRPRTQYRMSPEPMDWEPAQPVKIASTANRRNELSPAEFDRCRKEGRCFLCKETGHRALHCEKRNKTTRKKTSVVRTELKEQRVESSDEETVEVQSDEDGPLN